MFIFYDVFQWVLEASAAEHNLLNSIAQSLNETLIGQELTTI
jgi:hypothetical protein